MKLRKEQIFKAILEIISEKGVSHITTTEIAKRVGISQPALYKHFRSKDEIIIHFIEHLNLELQSIVEKASKKKDFFERLKALYEAHFEFVEKTKVIPRFPFSDELHGEKNRKKREIFRDKCFKFYLEKVEKIFRENGIKKVNEKMCAQIFLGSLISTSLKWMLSDMKYSIKKDIPSLIMFWKEFFKN